MKWMNNKICLEKREYVVPCIISEEAYYKQGQRHRIVVHGYGDSALIEFESIPAKYQELVVAKYGDPKLYMARQPLKQLVKNDMEARAFYEGYMLPDGRYLPTKYQQKYSRQSDWLNMINLVLGDKKALKQELRISMDEFWSACIILHQADEPINPELPATRERLTKKLKAYKEGGYGSLIIDHHRFAGDNARKVDSSIERLLLSLYCRQEKPYLRQVCTEYADFMAGRLQVIDLETGELFDPANYLVDGKPYEVREATVKHYLNKPLNRAIVDKVRLGALEFSSTHRPYMKRKAPAFSFSKITMDDITVPFKMPDGRRVWSYQVFDVASQAVIGVAFAKDKSQELIKEALRDMLRLVARKGWGIPFEIEVEQHLNSGMKGSTDDAGVFQADILTQGSIFPYVRFCAARNPQEKRAEGFIRLKKYGFQKKREGFQHRPFARLEANRMNEDADKVIYTYEQIVANEQADIQAYNNALHPDQDTYNGLTRWQVLEQHQNPKLQHPHLYTILPFIGMKTATSIRRGFVQVQYNHYSLPSMDILATLEDERVTAYYLPEGNGDIPAVYLYQDGEFICEAKMVERFQEAKAEQTADDLRIMGKQKQYITRFDEMVASGVSGLAKVGVIQHYDETQAPEQAIPEAEMPEEHPVLVPENSPKTGGFLQKNDGFDPSIFDMEEVKRRALKGL